METEPPSEKAMPASSARNVASMHHWPISSARVHSGRTTGPRLKRSSIESGPLTSPFASTTLSYGTAHRPVTAAPRLTPRQVNITASGNACARSIVNATVPVRIGRPARPNTSDEEGGERKRRKTGERRKHETGGNGSENGRKREYCQRNRPEAGRSTPFRPAASPRSVAASLAR